jgi:hypothetical protein
MVTDGLSSKEGREYRILPVFHQTEVALIMQHTPSDVTRQQCKASPEARRVIWKSPEDQGGMMIVLAIAIDYAAAAIAALAIFDHIFRSLTGPGHNRQDVKLQRTSGGSRLSPPRPTLAIAQTAGQSPRPLFFWSLVVDRDKLERFGSRIGRLI